MPARLAKTDFVGTGAVRYHVEGSMLALQVDYSEAPIPQHYYVSDYFRVAPLSASALLVFGKFDSIEKQDKLRSKLEVIFPATTFLRQFWASSRELHQTLKTHAEKYGLKPPTNFQEMTAEKTQTVHSNNVLMVFSGDESLADFYYLSPREVYFKTKKRKEVDLEPLARVLLEPQLLLGFLNACESIADSLSKKFPEDKEAISDSLESH